MRKMEEEEEKKETEEPELTSEEKAAQRVEDNASLIEFKEKQMRWDTNVNDAKWFDRHGVGILFYAVLMNNLRVVRELLNVLNEEFPSQGEEYNKIIESRLDQDGVLNLGLAGNASTLLIAMAFAQPDIVTLLVENGANKNCVDVFGNTTLHYCGIRGNVSAYQRYIELDTRYDIFERLNNQGSSPLDEALFQGANKMNIITAMIKGSRSCSSDSVNSFGDSMLMMAAMNEDCDLELLRYLHQHVSKRSKTGVESMVNLQARPKDRKHQKIFRDALEAMKVSSKRGAAIDALTEYMALHSGASAVHFAVMRGDLEIVRHLYRWWDCDLFMKNDLGLDTLDLCERGPYPKIRDLLKRYRPEQVVKDIEKAKEKKKNDIYLERCKRERERREKERAKNAYWFLNLT